MGKHLFKDAMEKQINDFTQKLKYTKLNEAQKLEQDILPIIGKTGPNEIAYLISTTKDHGYKLSKTFWDMCVERTKYYLNRNDFNL